MTMIKTKNITIRIYKITEDEHFRSMMLQIERLYIFCIS